MTNKGNVPLLSYSSWCNYPLISKSYQGIWRKYKASELSNQFTPATESQSRQSDTTNESHIKVNQSTSDEKKKLISSSKKKKRLLVPSQGIVSPWLKFGLEDDPWKENEFYKIPRLVESTVIAGPLTTLAIASGISNLSQTPDTKAFSVTKLQVSNRRLTDIELLRSFHCFQFIDISWNELSDLSPLENMVYLMCLNASHNRITNVLDMKAPWYLTYVSLACNQLTYISDLSEFWSLRHIDFSFNRISRIQGLSKLKYLMHLNLSHNDITCIENLEDLDIEELYLEYNKINSCDMTEMGTLKINRQIKAINLSHNSLNTLHFLKELENLRELHISHNQITSIEELDNLKQMNLLKKLSLQDNEICTLSSYKSVIIHYIPKLKILDGVKINAAEREAASVLLTSDLSVEQYKHLAKLMLYEQLSNPPIKNDTQPSGGKSLPLVCLVGPIGCSKQNLARRLSEEFGQFVYATTNHVMSSPNSKAYEKIFGSNYLISEDEFSSMIKQGQFLATSDLIGVSYGLSREEYGKSIEQGKLCLAYTDLLMAFCLQALGLNPFLILAITKDIETHQSKIMNICVEPAKGSLFKCQNEAVSTNPKSDRIESKTEADQVSDLSKKDYKKRDTQTSSIFYEIDKRMEQPNAQYSVESINQLEETFSSSGLNQILNCTDSCPNGNFFFNDSNHTENSEMKSCPSRPGQKKSSESLKNVKILISSRGRGFEGNTSASKISPNPSFTSLTKALLQEGDLPIAEDAPPFNYGSISHHAKMKPFSDKVSPSKKINLESNNDTEVCSGSGIDAIKSHNGSTGNWSWTSSNESVIFSEEELPLKETSRSSCSLSLKTINYILSKIIDSRKVYQDLQDTGYFSYTIYTDDVNKAYQQLKKTVSHIYNTKDEWELLYSTEKDPLCKEAIKQRIELLMRELDKTESTACLKNQ